MQILESGIAVIEGDSHHAAWVQQCGNLVHDPYFAEHVCRHIRQGDQVVDAGANIGTITRAMLDAGADVYAIEPNPEAFECLVHNCPTAKAMKFALSDVEEVGEMELSTNAGASFIRPSKDGAVRMCSLDELGLHPSLIKLDIEGFETRAIKGAMNTILNSRPIIICEVNKGALERAGSHDGELLQLIQSLGYEISIIQTNCKYGDPQFDILAIPK